ncbi:terminase small subunit [Arthrobacter phage SilentRX]|uniref:Terminase small subunit n=1 Tax=Arthrobacter phage SilentRX TaxID=2836091 RepID=A0A8F3E9T1_9CAUD|nr:terminase small subunit [Arthrobacter phage SilentRX]QWY82755.1 terminase small subunit [Arthrobacter phage SilentRX]
MTDSITDIDQAPDPDPDLPYNDIDNSETKAQAALTLKLFGASYTDIKNTLHYSSAYRARMAVERVLANAADSPEDRDKMRVLANKRIERLLSSVMSKAVDPRDKDHLAYNARALALIQAQGKIWGLDAPTQVQISATDADIQAYVEAIMPLAKADQRAIEGEILEADILEAED